MALQRSQRPAAAFLLDPMHGPQSPRKKAAGFTLTEVMIAMVLILMMSLAVFAGLKQVSQMAMGVAVRSEAYRLLQAEAERLLDAEYDSFTKVDEQTITSALKTTFGPTSTAALKYASKSENARGRITFKRRVLEVASTTNTRTLRVEVEWSWQNRTLIIDVPLFRIR